MTAQLALRLDPVLIHVEPPNPAPLTTEMVEDLARLVCSCLDVTARVVAVLAEASL